MFGVISAAINLSLRDPYGRIGLAEKDILLQQVFTKLYNVINQSNKQDRATVLKDLQSATKIRSIGIL